MDEIEKQAQLEVDELFVGLATRHSIWRSFHRTFVAEMILVGCVFLAIGNPIWLLLLVPTHSLMYVISSTDPGRFDSLTKYAMTNGRCLNRWFWKSAGFTPMGPPHFRDQEKARFSRPRKSEGKMKSQICSSFGQGGRCIRILALRWTHYTKHHRHDQWRHDVHSATIRRCSSAATLRI